VIALECLADIQVREPIGRSPKVKFAKAFLLFVPLALHLRAKRRNVAANGKFELSFSLYFYFKRHPEQKPSSYK